MKYYYVCYYGLLLLHLYLELSWISIVLDANITISITVDYYYSQICV